MVFAIGKDESLKIALLDDPGVMDFLQRLAECHQRALVRLKDCLRNENWKSSKSSRPSLFHNFVMDEAEQEFRDDPDIHYQVNRQLKTLVTPWFQLRIKKSTQQFTSMSFNRTFRTLAWVQKPLGDDFAPLDRVFLGYMVDQGWEELSGLALVEFRNRTKADIIEIPFEMRDVTPSHKGDFIEAPFRIKKDGIKRERNQDLFVPELDAGST